MLLIWWLWAQSPQFCSSTVFLPQLWSGLFWNAWRLPACLPLASVWLLDQWKIPSQRFVGPINARAPQCQLTGLGLHFNGSAREESSGNELKQEILPPAVVDSDTGLIPRPLHHTRCVTRPVNDFLWNQRLFTPHSFVPFYQWKFHPQRECSVFPCNVCQNFGRVLDGKSPPCLWVVWRHKGLQCSSSRLFLAYTYATSQSLCFYSLYIYFQTRGNHFFGKACFGSWFLRLLTLTSFLDTKDVGWI